MNIFIKVGLTALLLTTGFLKANSIAPNQNKKVFIEYYKDGIYDALEQIKKSAQEGLSEYPLRNQMKGKIIVVAEIGNLPINDIVRYKTIAIKNNYVNSITAKNKLNGKEYIIFDTFNRLADANYTIQRLQDYGIRAKIISGGEWTKDPIIIKRIATDLKKGLLSNVPVKVIKIERTIYKTDTPKILISQNKRKMPLLLKPLQATSSKSTKEANNSQHKYEVHRLVMLIYKIKQENCYSLENSYFLYKNKKYKEGDKIEGYKISKINFIPNKYGQKYLVVTFQGFDNTKMVFRKKPCCSEETFANQAKQPKLETKQAPKQQVIKQQPKLETKQEPKHIYYYNCNFAQVRAFYVPNLNKTKKISNTNYYFLQNKKSKVLFVKKTAKYVYFKQSGLSNIGLEKIAWEHICTPAQ